MDMVNPTARKRTPLIISGSARVNETMPMILSTIPTDIKMPAMNFVMEGIPVITIC